MSPFRSITTVVLSRCRGAECRTVGAMGVGQLWRVVAVFRVATLIYSGAIIVRDHHAYAHPAGGLIVLAVMTIWTVVVTAA
jgi:hypothetical protein